MINIRSSAIRSSYNGDCVKPDIAIDVLVVNVMMDCRPEIAQFHVIDRILWIPENAITARFHFYKNDNRTVQGNDVNIAMTRPPVTLYNGITLTPQVVSSQFFTPFPYLVM